ncbi:small secreted hydrophilic protein [Streptomyces sp. HD]|uniref:small secreted hydrophilic protein n=1 Tax=Streptomyces sp. HD TaxID=3020892 RepID=UPI00232D8190|nr:small secreted hydrophilic protein [Streptomyces sp. HD]MDC0772117.1 small secreted hydrophilic protein [Streptomyces sp. HD]
MVFSHRIAALAAVVAIPLGIAATSFALTDQQESPKVPPKVELDSGSPTPTSTRSTPTPTPRDEVVSRPPVTDSSPSDDDDDAPDREPSDDDRGEVGDDG